MLNSNGHVTSNFDISTLTVSHASSSVVILESARKSTMLGESLMIGLGLLLAYFFPTVGSLVEATLVCLALSIFMKDFNASSGTTGFSGGVGGWK